MSLDIILAQLEAEKVNLDAAIDLESKSNWEVAIVIGKAVSLYNHGYEDSFDAVEWTFDAQMIRQDHKTITLRQLLKIMADEYDLSEFA